jgi:hypothetical protein
MYNQSKQELIYDQIIAIAFDPRTPDQLAKGLQIALLTFGEIVTNPDPLNTDKIEWHHLLVWIDQETKK